MATGVKKGHVPEDLSHIRFAAWGSVDIETLGREPRRNYIMAVRAELATRGCKLECGGVAKRPYYRIYKPAFPNIEKAGSEWSVTSATVKEAFKSVCLQFLQQEDPEHVTGSAAAG